MPDLTPRELTCRALGFEHTPRVPRQLWTLPWAKNQYPKQLDEIIRNFPPDIENVQIKLPEVPCVRGDPHAVGTFIDEWGCAFVNIFPGIIGEVKTPMVQSYESDLAKVHPPKEWIKAKLEGVNEVCARSDRFMLASWGISLFERMQYLRGTQNLLIDLIDQPAGFFKLRDIIHEYHLAMIDKWSVTDVDGLFIGDDWGSQRSLLINPNLWRELFKPLYREYCDRIHGAGKYVFMHSDGYIFDIYQDLMDIKVDAINSQLFCMDIEDIGRRFKGRITFWGEIDRQHILPYATTDEVRRAVRRVCRSLYDGHGGVIAQCEFGVGAKPDNVRTVFEEWNNISGEFAAV